MHANSWEKLIYFFKSKSTLGLNWNIKWQEKTPNILAWNYDAVHAVLSRSCKVLRVLCRCWACLASGRIKSRTVNCFSVPQELLCPSFSRNLLRKSVIPLRSQRFLLVWPWPLALVAHLSSFLVKFRLLIGGSWGGYTNLLASVSNPLLVLAADPLFVKTCQHTAQTLQWVLLIMLQVRKHVKRWRIPNTQLKVIRYRYTTVCKALRDKPDHWFKEWESAVQGKIILRSIKVLLTGKKAPKIDWYLFAVRGFLSLPSAKLLESGGQLGRPVGCTAFSDVVLSSLFAELKQD